MNTSEEQGAFKHPCKYPGCIALQWDSYWCAKHKPDYRKQDNERRKEQTKRYKTRRWKALSKMVLARDPICRACNTNPSVEADHRIPVAEGGKDTFENLQGLCSSCHSKKTAQQPNSRYYRPKA